ncbi:MAG: hypothetical protein AAGA60_08925 [Cyanobacteria bacterium P01_E01_bin.42]
MQRFMIAIAGLLNLFLFLGCTSNPEAIDSAAVESRNDAAGESAIAPPHTASRQQVIARDTDTLISSEGIGKVKFGMTWGEVKAVLGPEVEYVLESPYIVDFDAIAVRQNGEVLFDILHPAGQPPQDDDLITSLQTNNSAFQTREGIRPGMTIQDAEKIYGEATLFVSEIELRESVRFAEQGEKYFHFGTLGGGRTNTDSYAGIYQNPNSVPRETQEYREDTAIQFISVTCNLDICWKDY